MMKRMFTEAETPWCCNNNSLILSKLIYIPECISTVVFVTIS